MDWTPTSEQVERGLNDVDDDIREAWAKRQDITPTREMVERGLNDVSGNVRCAWMDRLKSMQDSLIMDDGYVPESSL